MAIGFGPVGSGKRSSSSAFYKPWRFNSEDLGVNGMGLEVEKIMVHDERVYNGMRHQTVYGKAAGDPRVIHYHVFRLTFREVNRELVQRIEREEYYGRSFVMKFYQYDVPDIALGTPYADAEELVPSTPSALTCGLWFVNKRGISSDAGDGPFLYKDGTLQSSGIAWNYVEGAVLFATPPSSTANIRAYYVWTPRCRVRESSITPLVGRKHRDMRYDIQLTLKQD